jgi:hypothetical protein
LIHGRSPDGKGLSILRQREGRLEAGEVRALEHGKPITGDVVTLKPRQGLPWLCDVETHVKHGGQEDRGPRGEARGRPAQVASQRYRDNWESIYKGRGSNTLN